MKKFLWISLIISLIVNFSGIFLLNQNECGVHELISTEQKCETTTVVEKKIAVIETDLEDSKFGEKEESSEESNFEENNILKEEKREVTMEIVKKKKILKDVGEACMDHFGLQEKDFELMQSAEINIIEGNFDICATDEDVKYILDKSLEYGIKVIMPAGSGEAEWGYECDEEPYPEDQKPIWSKEKVSAFVNKWKSHEAVYAWDISNEAGSVFPNPTLQNMLTLEQLQTAYRDVKNTDNNHPIMIRMNGWYFYDYEDNFFREGNSFGKDVADIVMVNAYSNVDEYFPDFVSTVVDRSSKAIFEVNKDVEIFVALGAWEEKPLWVKPSKGNFNQEIETVKSLDNISGIAFFKYGVDKSEWYLPDIDNGAADLWEIITALSLP